MYRAVPPTDLPDASFLLFTNMGKSASPYIIVGSMPHKPHHPPSLLPRGSNTDNMHGYTVRAWAIATIAAMTMVSYVYSPCVSIPN